MEKPKEKLMIWGYPHLRKPPNMVTAVTSSKKNVRQPSYVRQLSYRTGSQPCVNLSMAQCLAE